MALSAKASGHRLDARAPLNEFDKPPRIELDFRDAHNAVPAGQKPWWAPLDRLPHVHAGRSNAGTSLRDKWQQARDALPPDGKTILAVYCDSTASGLSSPTMPTRADPGHRSVFERLRNRGLFPGAPGRAKAHRPLADHCTAVADALATVMDTSNQQQHGHHHGGGAVVVDLDEAVHGLYAAVAYLVQALKGNAGGIVQQFRDNAALLQSHPVAFMEQSGIPSGVSDLGVAAGVGTVLAPLAIMALKAGIEEMHGAYHTGRELRQNIAQAESALATIERLTNLSSGHAPLCPALDAQRLVASQTLSDLRFAQSQNIASGTIGAFSLSAGAAILAKAGVDIGTKAGVIAHGAAHGTVQGAHGVSVAAAGAAGVAGITALGPIAAVSSLGLGGAMVHKSRRARAAFKERSQPTFHALPQMNEAGEKAGTDEFERLRIDAYCNFLEIKLDQRQAFHDHFLKWNAGFLAGSALYTGSALGKVALVAAVAGGAAVVANPYALAALLATGTVAGVAMALCSHQFLSGHGDQHRYETYQREDDPELNRAFLASVDLMGGDDPHLGLRLRAQFHEQITTRNTARQELLQTASRQAGKRFDSVTVHSTDSTETAQQFGGKKTHQQIVANKLRRTGEAAQGRLKAAGAFGAQIVAGHAPSDAAAAARDRWNQSRAHLTRTHLRDWMAEDAHVTPLLRAMEQMTVPQITFMERKQEAKNQAYDQIIHRLTAELDGLERAAALGQADQTVQQDAAMVCGLMTQLRDDMERDRSMLVQARGLHQTLVSLRTGAAPRSDAAMAQVMNSFVDAQNGMQNGDLAAQHPVADIQDSRAKLADYLLKKAPERDRGLRGKLLETEITANKLRALARV